ncbi:pyrimidine reductase family protein [Streptomyces sp. H10-C2]|uniref:pyrimidine reductase family protein n=1 Tax=unclassified Streptomyces TaxID=2593676 RepID=UPI0024B99B40|nr:MULTISPECIES: pyrimidine reductase family protein [unclassified Streptomyces]MDJ0340686.1 pyrimidine reductase family protein [Streptomyces sp. PH10-H1]MDJ0372042.1 pyrimidine reductase family protein [Streptomyces sp. H10-C2]
MRRLYPVPSADETAAAFDSAGSAHPLDSPGSAGSLDSLDGLADAYAYPDRARGPWLRANMVASLDGAARHEGRSQGLSSAADLRVFGVLRALADVVVVGAETVRQEGYRPAKAREAFADRRAAAGQPPAPVIAVLSASLDLDFSLPLFTEPVTQTLVVTGATAPADRVAAATKAGARVVVAGDGAGADPARTVRALADLGLTRLLHEGGPKVLAQFAVAGVVDELCLTIAPLITAGDASRIMNGPGIAVPKRFSPTSILEEDGFLFTRYSRG